MSMVTSCTLLSRAALPAKLPRGALQSGKPAAVALQTKPRPLSVRYAPGNAGHASSDHPGEVSMTLQYPLLTRSNYATWAVKMKVFMCAQGIWEAVEDDVDAHEHTNQTALAAIFQGIPEEILPLLAKMEKAKTVWDMLKTMYAGEERVKKARAQTLMGEFESLRMMDTESLDDFAVRLRTLAKQLGDLGEKMKESYIIKKFLRAVPNKYLQIVSIIEQVVDSNDTELQDVISCLKEYERLRIPSGNNDLQPSK